MKMAGGRETGPMPLLSLHRRQRTLSISQTFPESSERPGLMERFVDNTSRAVYSRRETK